jgi:cell fate (sporulation/competence/biofilm development) regulator YlbF (YheA/YmcA/DUF963 family)
MSIMERQALDMATLLMKAYDIGDMIKASSEVEQYIHWKHTVEQLPEVKVLVRKLNDKKEIFEQCERFGHFHPEYHSALDKVKEVEAELERIEAVAMFKQSENKLDELLYEVSELIAYSVSDSIKVPSNNPLPHAKGCGSGGSCNCG